MFETWKKTWEITNLLETEKSIILDAYTLPRLFLCKLETNISWPAHTTTESPVLLQDGNSCISSLFSTRLLWTPSSQLKPKDQYFCISLDLAADLLHSCSVRLRKWGQRVKPPLSKIYPFKYMSVCCDAWCQYLYRWISSLKNHFVCFYVDHSPCCNVSQLDPAHDSCHHPPYLLLAEAQQGMGRWD